MNSLPLGHVENAVLPAAPYFRLRLFAARNAQRIMLGIVACLTVAILATFVSTHYRPMLLALLAMPFLMTLSIYTDLPQYSFKMNVPNALVGKEGYPVEIVPGTLNIDLLGTTAGGLYIGQMFEHLEGSQMCRVNLRGPIRKGVVGAAPITVPSYVVNLTGAGLTAVAAGSGNKVNGIVIYPLNTTNPGDICSYIQFDGVAGV